MADLSKFLNSGGAGFRLAPDLTWPSQVSLNDGYKKLNIPTTPGAYVSALSLTGKFAIGLISFTGLTSEQIDIKLTIDGVLVWDGGQRSTGAFVLLGNFATATNQFITCDSSLLLEIRTTSDTSCELIHDARPIL